MALLSVENLHVSYGAIRALHGISFHVKEGEIVTLIGANGAGKSTTLRAISGLLLVDQGRILYEGKDITNASADQIVRMGIVHVPEGRKIFAPLTVRENLEMGAFTRKDKREIEESMEFVFNLFPRLRERAEQMGGTLSGGEQQMLAVARALMAKPRLLLMDEPSMGLAPILVEEIFEVIQRLNREEGVTILLVEQNAHMALSVAHRGYVLETGTIQLEGTAEELRTNPRVREAYLGGD
ncbi:MAG: ABC transporter ATP-binding protein [Anaerolineae bacterium]|nr:ABC transporter ATP-binding protein [Anaerolineae bacterium]MCX8066631.1 ABC transporter ATP-binding protein [Anaerolineae bacterium]MDW7992548.1 ABC transporter ATP-binding protein [Anaerolineae bacterium]